MLNKITVINESKTLTKHISCQCKCKSDGWKCNSDQWWNNKCRCECKKLHVCEKDHIWNPATCSCESGKYLASIMDDSTIRCDEILESYEEETKLFQQILMKRKQPIKRKITFIFINYYSTIDSC